MKVAVGQIGPPSCGEQKGCWSIPMQVVDERIGQT